MDAASLLTGLLLGALLATAVTLGVVTLTARRRPEDTGLEPVHESLDHLHRLLAGMERARATAHGELREQMGTVGSTSAQLKHETAALVTALRTPHVRGRWGEVQLRRVVEVAGLVEHCDFVEQPAGTNDAGAGVRPDLVVTLADGRQVIVDAKVPFTGSCRPTAS
jgi:DNA recombination protein RmuC